MSEPNIVYEKGDYYIYKVSQGYYEVRKNGITHATLAGTFHFPKDPVRALGMAMNWVNGKTK